MSRLVEFDRVMACIDAVAQPVILKFPKLSLGDGENMPDVVDQILKIRDEHVLPMLAGIKTCITGNVLDQPKEKRRKCVNYAPLPPLEG